MLGKVRIMVIAAATLLASPAFAGWPADQSAQVDLIGGQRIMMPRPPMSCGRFQIGSAALSIKRVNAHTEVT